MTRPSLTEKERSQVPALQLLANLGYSIMPAEDALVERGGRYSNVLLEGVLSRKLQEINRISHRGTEYRFSEANVQEAVNKLKEPRHSGLLRNNSDVHELLTLGTSLEQTVDGDRKSHQLKYIDWSDWRNNEFHAVPEFAVERTASAETARPDIVLFVNGIPLAVIECKKSSVDVNEAVQQQIRNQGDQYIPRLFTYAQLLMAVNVDAAKYATVGTKRKLWSIWKELDQDDPKVNKMINTPLSEEQKERLFSGDFARLRQHFDREESKGRKDTEQDRAIYCLCRPERLLELARRFTLFEGKNKVIARYQQYFVVRAALERIRQRNDQGRRSGGVIWHTQGSGKSLTMVMLIRALAQETAIMNRRIVLVTDRVDLDKQLAGTFKACDLEHRRATSGRNLVQLIKDRTGVITTVINKFGVNNKFVDESSDVFVLVDECHRSHYGELEVPMRRILPNACYIGFTGTPLLKEEKNSFHKFGPLIEPSYSVRRAVDDEAVVPLLYEGRAVEVAEKDKETLDRDFEEYTRGMNPTQKKDLKNKLTKEQVLNRSASVIQACARDISKHYRDNWQMKVDDVKFKAQLVAPSKKAAIEYHRQLSKLGKVSSAVVISPPSTIEGHEEVNEQPAGEVQLFWAEMMKKYGTEARYLDRIVSAFKDPDSGPEILIVVDKLLTGFDAPLNTVMYLCKRMQGHNLLQAIARVNRLYTGKDNGYIIDYVGVLEKMDQALHMYDFYDAFGGYDEEDIADALISIKREIEKLPQRHHDLLDMFKEVRNRDDQEQVERSLAHEDKRQEFYELLRDYARTLAIALSSSAFHKDTDERQVQQYKEDLKYYMELRKSVQLRYGERVDFKEHEARISNLMDKHIQAGGAMQLVEPVDIFDAKAVAEVRDGTRRYRTREIAARADTLAHATKKTIQERMEQDPAFYKPISELLQKAIDDFRNRRISDSMYLKEVEELSDRVVSKKRDDVPERIRDNGDACAYYGAVKKQIDSVAGVDDDVMCEVALMIQKLLKQGRKVDFWEDDVAKDRVRNRIDDFFYEELGKKHGIKLNDEQMDGITDAAFKIAESRSTPR